MNWLKSIGFGILLFALMFMSGSILMFVVKLTGIALEMVMFIALLIVLGVLVQMYKIGSLLEGIQVGLVWLIIYSLLDYIVIVQTFSEGDATYYTHWSLWVWYALMIVVPAFFGYLKVKRAR